MTLGDRSETRTVLAATAALAVIEVEPDARSVARRFEPSVTPLLSNEEVHALLPMIERIAVLDDAYRELTAGRGVNRRRSDIDTAAIRAADRIVVQTHRLVLVTPALPPARPTRSAWPRRRPRAAWVGTLRRYAAGH